MAFDWKENPLKDVKVEIPQMNLEKLAHFLLYGNTNDYKKRGKLRSIEERNKVEGRVTF